MPGVRRLDKAIRDYRSKTTPPPATAPKGRAVRALWRARLRCEGALWAIAVLRREAEALDLTDEWLMDAGDLLAHLEERARRAELKMGADLDDEALAAIYLEVAGDGDHEDSARRFVGSFQRARDALAERGYDRRTE